MEEIWKDIEGYEGIYQVSSFGRVKRLAYYRECKSKKGNNYHAFHEEKILKIFWRDSLHHYLGINFYKHGKRKSFPIHRLVAESFIPNPDNLTEVNHIDEDKTNNHVDNLEWVSHIDNCRYGTAIERRRIKTLKPVIKFSKEGFYLDTYTSVTEAAIKNGIDYHHISMCCHERMKSAGGFIWKFKK